MMSTQPAPQGLDELGAGSRCAQPPLLRSGDGGAAPREEEEEDGDAGDERVAQLWRATVSAVRCVPAPSARPPCVCTALRFPAARPVWKLAGADRAASMPALPCQRLPACGGCAAHG